MQRYEVWDLSSGKHVYVGTFETNEPEENLIYVFIDYCQANGLNPAEHNWIEE
jgi:hypothetical protein